MTTVLCALAPFIGTPAHAAPPEGLVQKSIFVSGTDGYDAFRIPALIAAPDGTLLAFAEGRKESLSDTGDIDIVLKRSFNGGALWQPMEIIWDDGPNVCGNPCPVIDSATGAIHLLLTHNLGGDSEKEIMEGTADGSRTVWIMSSYDNGASWSKPADITKTTKLPDWTWYATGPGIGIQTKRGRLVIPCDHAMMGTKEYGSHVIVSDDGGKTWSLGGLVRPKCNECQIVEREDGKLLLNMRSYHGLNRRFVSLSGDDGLSWTEAAPDTALIEPVCQASLIRYSWKVDGTPGMTLFSNPADTKRVKMTVRASYDDCATWPVSRTLYEGPAAYSCLAALPDGGIGCLYERGENTAYETITFAVFPPAWLMGK